MGARKDPPRCALPQAATLARIEAREAFPDPGASKETRGVRGGEARDGAPVDRSTGQMRVTYSQVPEDRNDLALLTRSMLQIMVNMATQVEVPEEHAAEGRTPPTRPMGEVDTRVMRIHSSPERCIQSGAVFSSLNTKLGMTTSMAGTGTE